LASRHRDSAAPTVNRKKGLKMKAANVEKEDAKKPFRAADSKFPGCPDRPENWCNPNQSERKRRPAF